jgi:IS5 family transposase
LRTSRVRADTTVVPANVCYPTDSGLLAKAIRRIGTAGARIHHAGGAVRTRLRDRSRAAGKRAHGIAAKLRSRRQLGRDQVKDGVQRITGELADLAQTPLGTRTVCWSMPDGRCAAHRLRLQSWPRRAWQMPPRGRRRGRLAHAVNDLANLLDATAKITEQARQRIAGRTPDGATRVVSLHPRDARPIAKGRLGKPVEFGYKGQVIDNDDGIVLDHQMHVGNPADAPQLAPAIHRVKTRTGRPPRTVTADRGYGEAAVERDLCDLGVRTVVVPRKGRPGTARQHVEKRRTFRRTIKWRTGCEGRISTLKRGYGWDRTRLDSLEGAKTWTGQGVFTHNLTRIAALIT